MKKKQAAIDPSDQEPEINLKQDPLLFEIAWEVCNQVGGIYTVIRSKIPCVMDGWGERYCLIGPYFPQTAASEFEPTDEYDSPYGKIVLKMREAGFDVHYGRWLVSGRPRVILFNPASIYTKLSEIKYYFWENHFIQLPFSDDLINQVVAFGELVKIFFMELNKEGLDKKFPVVAHFHEWMAGTAIPDIRRENLNLALVFTTHATLLGRYLAMNDANFYERLPYLSWEEEAKRFNVEAIAKLERAAAHGSTVFTTVSEVTAMECVHLLGRKPDLILPNGINIERFSALHHFQNLHQEYKEEIHEFVMGHFFSSYSFDLNHTLYFFTSGRFEYRNKGFDLTLEALARLNYKMKITNIDKTVVMFFVTKQPYHNVNSHALHERAVMGEIHQTCEDIKNQLGERLFYAAASSPKNEFPDLNQFVDDYWKLRLRRTIQSWRSKSLPLVVTHNLVNDQSDPILNFLRTANLVNHPSDKVKIVYHPDFISPTNPLFGLEYGQFVRGCHLGVFPSYYEPWGYTPLECIASGVPAITSDLAGFGNYVQQTVPDYEDKGMMVINRRNKQFNEAADQLANMLFSYVQLKQRDRIMLRNKVERSSEIFDWRNLSFHYQTAHELALERHLQGK